MKYSTLNQSQVIRVGRDLTRRQVILALSGMLVFVTLLAFYFGAQSLRLDEAQSLWQSARGPFAILSIVAQDVHVPLYHELLRLWRILIGDSVASGRAFSLLWFMLSIPALYWLGSYLYNRSIGLFAALLLAVSPFMNWYGSEIRMYTMFTFVAIINHYFFIKLYREGSTRTMIAYTLTALLGLYTHYFFFFILGTQAIFYLVRRHSFRPGSLKLLSISWMFLALAFSPWVWYVISSGQIASQEPVLQAPTSVNLFSTFSQFLFGFQDDHLNTILLSLWPITILFAFLALRQSKKTSGETEYLILSVFVPILLAFLGSVFIEPVFVSRYLIFTIPALFLLLANILSLYPPKISFITRSLVVGLMALGLVIEMTSSSVPVKENYQDAVTYLNTHAAPQDVVVLSAPFTLYPVEYYYRGSAPIATLPIWNQYAHGAIPSFNQGELPSQVNAVTSSYQLAWVLLSYDQGYEKNIKEYFDTHYAKVLAKNFSPGLDLYVYQLRYDTPLAASASARVKD